MDRARVRALVLAKTWTRQLETGEVASIKALARREGFAITTPRVCRRWPLSRRISRIRFWAAASTGAFRSPPWRPPPCRSAGPSSALSSKSSA